MCVHCDALLSEGLCQHHIGRLAADAGKFDEFDLAQLRHVVAVCRSSVSAAAAAKRLFAVSRAAKKSANDSDRLTKYLARFGLKFREIAKA